MSSSPSQWKPAVLVVALAALACASGGCGGSKKLVEVKGKVTVGGQPLTSGSVQFRPDKAKGNTNPAEPIGEINSQGEYTLMTNGKPGAPLGAYKVTVSSTGATTPDNTKVSTQQLVNTTYNHADTTPLEKTVVEQPAAGAYDLALTP
jgi:hypothetical protein